LLNYYFTPPIHRWTVAASENLLALVVFVLVAVAISATVDQAARRTRDAAQARAEASTLSTVAGSVLRGGRPLPSLLEQGREMFSLASVTLLERRTDVARTPDMRRDPTKWRVAASAGGRPAFSPSEGDLEVPVDDNLSLVLTGHTLAASDQRVVEA